MGWRLPGVHELSSLVDPTRTSAPLLPVGHPFRGVRTRAITGQPDEFYWTTSKGNLTRGKNDTVMFIINKKEDARFYPESSFAQAWAVKFDTGGAKTVELGTLRRAHDRLGRAVDPERDSFHVWCVRGGRAGLEIY